MRNLFFIMLFMAVTAVGRSQNSEQSFTLEEAIDYTLKNNYDAINAKREVVDAKKQKWEVIASGLPQINGGIHYQNQLKQPVTLVPSEFLGGQPGTFQPLVFGPPHQVGATAIMQQQIFDGTYIVGVQATKAFLDYSDNNLEKTAQELRKSVVQAYGSVLLAQESIAILERNKTTLEKNLDEIGTVYENGLVEQESVEQLEITLSSIDSRLKNAIRLEVTTYKMLNLILGIPIDTPIHLSDNLDDLAQKQIVPGLFMAEFNIENNVDFKLATNLNQQRYYEWKLARSRALPTLSAFVNYGTSAYADNFDFLGNDQKWYDSSIWGLQLSIPIFSSFKRSASTQRAKIALEQAKTQLLKTEQEIGLRLQQTRSTYILAVEQFHTSKKNLFLAERIEDKNQTKFSQGVASSFDLRQAQTQLYAAQQEYLQSMVEVINQKTALEILISDDSNGSDLVDNSRMDKNVEAKDSVSTDLGIAPDTLNKMQNYERPKIEIEKPDEKKVAAIRDTNDRKNIVQAGQYKDTITSTRDDGDLDKVAIYHLPDVEEGFYLIANVFSKKRYMESFLSSLIEQGLSPGYFFNDQKRLYYVYLERYGNIHEAKKTKISKVNERYKEELWILWVKNRS